MENGKKILLKFLIVLVVIICADNGKSFALAGDSIQILLNHHNDKNSEESHQNHFSNLNDDEKWVQVDRAKILSSNLTLLPSLFNAENPSGDFSDNVWQPPRNI